MKQFTGEAVSQSQFSKDPLKLEEELRKLENELVKKHHQSHTEEERTGNEEIHNSIRMVYEKYIHDLSIVEEYAKAGDFKKAKDLQEMAWMNFSDKLSQIKEKGTFKLIEAKESES